MFVHYYVYVNICIFRFKIMKYFYIKCKYNLITTNKYNQNKKFNTLNYSKLAIKLYAIVSINVRFNLKKIDQNPL